MNSSRELQFENQPAGHGGHQESDEHGDPQTPAQCRAPISRGSLEATHHTILPTHPTRPSSRGFEQDIGVKFATLRHDATYDRRMRIQIAMLMLFLAGCAEEPTEVGKIPNPQPAPGITARGPSSEPIPADSTSSSDRLPTPSTDGATQARFAGFEAPIPASWTLRPEPRQFRAATFVVPAQGDGDQGELAIFAGIRGSDEANIDRWEGRFQEPTGGPGQAIVDPMPNARSLRCWSN